MDLIINSMMVWLALLIIFIGIEIATMGLTTIWFAGGALVAIVAAVLNAPLVIQILLFVVVSLLLLFFTRPVAVKYFNRDRVRTNVESMVGRQAIVTGDIDNLKATGQVTVSGQEWSARSCDDRVQIPVGSVVKVLAINGVKLIVVPESQMQSRQRPVQPEAGREQQPGAPVEGEGSEPQAADSHGSADNLQAEVSDKEAGRESADMAQAVSTDAGTDRVTADMPQAAGTGSEAGRLSI